MPSFPIALLARILNNKSIEPIRSIFSDVSVICHFKSVKLKFCPQFCFFYFISVHKDKNNNFEVKQFHEKYGFDLKAAVEKFPITDLKEADKEKALMQSLQKGNVQSVTIEKDGSSHKMFIEADPQFKKVNLYDSNMKLVAKESVEKYHSVEQTAATKAVKEEQGNDKKKELKQELKLGKEKVEKRNDKTLLPKKRESSKKGLGYLNRNPKSIFHFKN